MTGAIHEEKLTLVGVTIAAVLAASAVSAGPALAASSVQSATAAPTCLVHTIPFSPSYMTTIAVTNTTASTISGWAVGFTLPVTMSVRGLNGTATREGSTGTLTPAPWYTSITPGFTATLLLLGSGSPFATPADFTVNGNPCTAA